MNKIIFLLICVSFVIFGCATTQYHQYFGKENVFEGRGGTKKIIEGIDFWDNGEPPRKFVLLGIIDDKRPGGIIPMSSLESDIAKKAKEAGGDAVIVLANNSKITGYINTLNANTNFYGSTANTYGSGMSLPARQNYSKFAVIKYADNGVTH